MKKYNILLVLSLTVVLYLSFKIYQYEIEIRKLNRVEYLINEGYSLEASKHISDVEFGVILADYEYQALMED